MVLLPVCRIFLSFRCCCPVKLFWIPKYQGRIPCSLFSPFRYFCDAEKSDSHEQRCPGLHLLLQIREFLPTVGTSMSPRWSRTMFMMSFQTWWLCPLKDSWKKAFEWSTLSGKQRHRTSLMKTSVLLRQNIRTFAQRSPMFCIFRTATSHPPFPPLQKKFWKISYISYTTAQDVQYLLIISGEG